MLAGPWGPAWGPASVFVGDRSAEPAMVWEQKWCQRCPSGVRGKSRRDSLAEDLVENQILVVLHGDEEGGKLHGT